MVHLWTCLQLKSVLNFLGLTAVLRFLRVGPAGTPPPPSSTCETCSQTRPHPFRHSRKKHSRPPC